MLMAEKQACERIEREYNEILMQKQQQLETEMGARMEAEQKVASLSAELEHMRQIIDEEVESKDTKRREQLVLEAESQKRRMDYDMKKEARKQNEIMKIEFEFQQNQTETYYKDQIAQLHQKIEYLQSGFVKEKEIQFNQQLREQIIRLEEKNVHHHAETTKNLYEEISTALKARFKDEEVAKLAKQREKLE